MGPIMCDSYWVLLPNGKIKCSDCAWEGAKEELLHREWGAKSCDWIFRECLGEKDWHNTFEHYCPGCRTLLETAYYYG